MSDELPPPLGELFAQERASPGPSDRERARIRGALTASLGIAAGAVTSASAAAASTGAASGAATGASLTAGLATKVIVLAVAIAAAGGGAALLMREPTDSAPPAVSPGPTPTAPPDRAAPAVERPAPTDPGQGAPAVEAPAPTERVQETSVVEELVPTEPAQIPPVRRPARTPPPAPLPVPTQSALLADAWSALARGDAATVLALVEQDAREHPLAQLREEREALRIEALVRLRRRDEAREHARAFATMFPDSIHRPAIERVLRDESSADPARER